ncbi:O-acetyltransferase OatA [Stieleria neptunia]|uniref:O-acetyltransferase OatA n=1 Tax=Stieleria neptunia TaxID=2527979 RepID=A0A518HQX7_9BACT|nr:acyltransferase [Stieleria neptunia]QDV43244.1 O-acetyltransferase OatA [Stieleria neptunia]
MNPSSRNAWLDVLRAMAIVLVINCHTASTHAHQFGPTTWTRVWGIGGHGVDLFFVLSGWLLGNLLFRELKRTGRVQLTRFWGRRWLRTLPAYYTVLVLTLAQAIWQGRFEWRQMSFFVFFQTYIFESQPFFGVSWSLCVEEHFYLIIAPLILVIGKRRHLGLAFFFLMLGIPVLLRVYGLYEHRNQTHVRLDQCASGVALAYFFVFYPVAWGRLKQSLPVLALIALALATGLVLNRVGVISMPERLAYFTFISMVLVLFSEYGRWWQSRAHHPLILYLATRSYSLYLVHIEAISLVDKIHIENALARCAVIWFFSLLCAELLYRLIERPGMELRGKMSTLRSEHAPVPKQPIEHESHGNVSANLIETTRSR